MRAHAEDRSYPNIVDACGRRHAGHVIAAPDKGVAAGRILFISERTCFPTPYIKDIDGKLTIRRQLDVYSSRTVEGIGIDKAGRELGRLYRSDAGAVCFNIKG